MGFHRRRRILISSKGKLKDSAVAQTVFEKMWDCRQFLEGGKMKFQEGSENKGWRGISVSGVKNVNPGHPQGE